MLLRTVQEFQSTCSRYSLVTAPPMVGPTQKTEIRCDRVTVSSCQPVTDLTERLDPDQ
jgi:hypothetical protein